MSLDKNQVQSTIEYVGAVSTKQFMDTFSDKTVDEIANILEDMFGEWSDSWYFGKQVKDAVDYVEIYGDPYGGTYKKEKKMGTVLTHDTYENFELFADIVAILGDCAKDMDDINEHTCKISTVILQKAFFATLDVEDWAYTQKETEEIAEQIEQTFEDMPIPAHIDLTFTMERSSDNTFSFGISCRELD